MWNPVKEDRFRTSPFNHIPSFGHLFSILGYVYTIPNNFPKCVVWIATVQNWNKSLTHIEQFGRDGFVNRVHTESWILEKVLKFAQQFPDLEKAPAFFLRSVLITFLVTLSLEKEIIVMEKSLEKVLNFGSKNLYELCVN